MKTNKIPQEEIIGKNILVMLVITGFAFSIASFFVLDEGIQQAFSTFTDDDIQQPFCERGLCYVKDNKEDYEQIFVQQGNIESKTNQVSKNEDFTNLQLVKHPTKDYKISANKVTLFAEKDSFIREGIKTTNEGSNKVLKILGTGSINNRALIAFNHDDIKNIVAGKNIDSATLKLHVEQNNHNWGKGQYLNIHSLTTNWNEGTGINAPTTSLFEEANGVSWNCAQVDDVCNFNWEGGNFNKSPTDSVWISNQVEGYWVKFDVTDDILNYLSTGENFGWIIMKSDEESTGLITISSRESQSFIPELVLVFSDE